jgi:hypothetical protein
MAGRVSPSLSVCFCICRYLVLISVHRECYNSYGIPTCTNDQMITLRNMMILLNTYSIIKLLSLGQQLVHFKLELCS